MWIIYCFMIVITLLITVYNSMAIFCYSCENKNKGPCFDIKKHNLSTIDCNVQDKNYAIFDTTRVGKTEYHCAGYKLQGANGTFTERSCIASILASGYCNLISSSAQTANQKVVHCYTCNTDSCSSCQEINICATTIFTLLWMTYQLK